MTKKGYDFKAIEKKWQKEWEKKKIFQVKEGKKRKFYLLEMYPYPSGSGLHMGHAFNYTVGDIFARMKRMQGFNVLYPMGYDSFGLPAENAAIKEGIHPKEYTERAINNYIKQMKNLGLSYDWSRILMTHKPEYYKWNQYFFLKLLEKGLTYRKKSPVNWCPKCNSVLANEQVHNGKCWIHKTIDVEIRQLEQWFIRTTEYSDELLEKAEKLNWPSRIKLMQKNWIGRSEGTEIIFEVGNKKWKIFTTRPDTIFGVTFMVVSAQHPRLFELVTTKQKQEVEKFLKKIKGVSEKEIEEMEKEGVFTGSYATNPMTKEKVPIYAGNFVFADYGSGMVMAVPAHDQRDFEFARKYKLPIRQAIGCPKNHNWNKEAYTGEGNLINSKDFNGVNSEEAKEHIVKFLETKRLGKKTVQYKFRDWLISRQRYWGTPIPIIYCDKCGVVPVPEKDLPVVLPEKVKFGKGNPLATSKNFVSVKCPKCGANSKRETDTMDTFFDSSWYYLRYCDSENVKKPFDQDKVKYWMPVDQYIGGAEHATMHLIYARFFTKALRDMDFLKFDEPFTRLFNQGMLHGPDGFVMSKSRGNVVLPEKVSEKYGIDTARFFLVSVASTEKDTEWSDKGVEGSLRFINKVTDFFGNFKPGKPDARIESKLNKTIREVGEDIDGFCYNLATIKLRALFDKIFESRADRKTAESFLKMLHPFCPHITEELWHKLGHKNFISLSDWPTADEKKINPEFEKEAELIDSLVDDVNNVVGIIKAKNKTIKKLYIYVIPKESDIYLNNLDILSKRTGLKTGVFSVADKNKYDPEGKAKKAKQGKPGIYLE